MRMVGCLKTQVKQPFIMAEIFFYCSDLLLTFLLLDIGTHA